MHDPPKTQWPLLTDISIHAFSIRLRVPSTASRGVFPHFLPSLPMDFDLNTALNNTQPAIYAVQNQQAGHPDTTVPPHTLTVPANIPEPQGSTTGSLTGAAHSPVSGLATTQTSFPTTYHKLPPEILRQVSAHMPFDDISNLSPVNKGTYHALQERRLSWLCYQRAANAKALDLALVQQLLTEIERIREPMLRAKPFEALWPRLSSLPEEQQTAAFRQVFEAAGCVPKYGLPIQKDMIRSIRDFQELQQLDLYHLAYADAERRSVEQGSTWAAVASILIALPEQTISLIDYQHFFDRIPTLAAADRADLITELVVSYIDYITFASLLGQGQEHVPVDECERRRRQTYRICWEWVQRLPKSYQGAPIGALASVAWVMPREELPAHYAELRRLIQSLPDHQLGSALRYLPIALRGLPDDQLAHELSLLEPLIQRVPLAQHTLVAAGLLQATRGMDDAISAQVWQRALRLLDVVNEADVLNVLLGLEKTDYLPTVRQALQLRDYARTEIIALTERNHFSQQTRSKVLDFILRNRDNRDVTPHRDDPAHD